MRREGSTKENQLEICEQGWCFIRCTNNLVVVLMKEDPSLMIIKEVLKRSV